MSHQAPKLLPIKPISQAVEEAKTLMDIERSGVINGLYTRWSIMNRANFKFWRFRSVTAIAGTSGSGKSAILNMLEDDFTNLEINPLFKDKIVIVAFKYEMDAADEVLRNLSGKVKKSYAYLLSSKIDEIASKGKEKDVYNILDDNEFKTYSDKLDELKTRPIQYIESAGNLEQLYYTCAKIKSENPTKRLIITLDHTLLSQKLSEKDDLELASHTAHTAIRLKKTLDAMVIFLVQMNGEIEKPIRRDNPALQYPVKTDIHCGNQLYWACDNVLIFHQPSLLNIDKYGNKTPLKTKDLIHCAWIKSRKNKSGNLWFQNKFEEGGMNQLTEEQLRKDWLWKADATKLF